jgi:lactate permease
LPTLTPDRMMQALLMGWLFASLLQGMGGFGVPVAVAAPLLVGLGFQPVQAVIMACIGHGWAVNFGSLATSFQTLLAVTNLPGQLLAPEAALLLGISAFPCGAIVAYVACGRGGLLRSLPAVAVLSLVMGGVQYLLVTNELWTLGATGGALTGLLAGVALSRLPFYSRNHDPQHPAPGGPAPRLRSLALASVAYVILIVLAFAINLIQPLYDALDLAQVNLNFPALSTAFGFVTPAGPGRSISLFNHPGAILLYASGLAYLLYRRAGLYQPGARQRILNKTVRGAVTSSLGIASMVGMAVIMSHSGMTNLLAEGLSYSFGKLLYPAVAPLIGAVGAFITGSNNNSNVLFAALQMRTAELLGLSVTLILAAQTAGGSLGSIMAPAKVIVGCSTVGLGDHEGVVIGKILLYGIIPVLLVSVLTLILAGG